MKFYFTAITNPEYLTYLTDHDCCDILISYLDKNKIKSLIDRDLPNARIFVDSGAFSAYTRGVVINLDEYIEFLNTYHNKLALYASLDIIPNYQSFESVRQSSIDTWNNFLYMREKLIDKSKCVVTFHFGEDYSVLEKILTFEDEHGKIENMALGGLARANADDRYTFLEKCYEIIRKLNRKDIKLHLFGVTDMSLCEEFGADSVDSTTWVRAASFGEICTAVGRLVVSENRTCDPSHLLNKTDYIKNVCLQEIKEAGFELEDLMTSSKSRELYNILYFHKKAQSITPPKYDRVVKKVVELW